MLPGSRRGARRFQLNHINAEHVLPKFRERVPSLDDFGAIALLAKKLKAAGGRTQEGFRSAMVVLRRQQPAA